MDSRTKIDRSACAVIVIDVQHDYCSPEGLAAREGTDVSGYPPVVDRIGRLVAGARGAAVPVVWVQTVRDAWATSTVWNARHGMALTPPPGDTRPPKCMRGTWGAEFFRIAPEDGEPIITKRRYSAFAGTDLALVLRTLGIRSLLFTGIATDVCVESSLRDALFEDFHVVLVEDCCAGTDEPAHDATVRAVGSWFGPVVTARQVLEHWSAAPAAER